MLVYSSVHRYLGATSNRETTTVAMEAAYRALLNQDSIAYQKYAHLKTVENHMIGSVKVGKGDGRGAHWKAKVLDGNPPKPWKSMREWSNLRLSMECNFELLKDSEEFDFSKDMGMKLPWGKGAHCPPCGNMVKVAYMQLKIFEEDGIIVNVKRIEDKKKRSLQESLFGIVYFEVLLSSMAQFNQSPMRSMYECSSDKEKKRVVNCWNVAGFGEKLQGEDRVVYVHQKELRMKVLKRYEKGHQHNGAAVSGT